MIREEVVLRLISRMDYVCAQELTDGYATLEEVRAAQKHIIGYVPKHMKTHDRPQSVTA